MAATTRRLSTEALGPTDALPGAACGTTEEEPVANTAAAAKDAEHAVSDGVDDVVRLGAGEVLTLQHAAYVTEAQAHADLNLPPLRQSLPEVAAELDDPHVLDLGWRDVHGRLIAAVRARLIGRDAAVAEIGPPLAGKCTRNDHETAG